MATRYEIIRMNYNSKQDYKNDTPQVTKTSKVMAAESIHILEVILETSKQRNFKPINRKNRTTIFEHQATGEYETYEIKMEERPVEWFLPSIF